MIQGVRKLWKPKRPVSLVKAMESGGPAFILRTGKNGRTKIIRNWGNQ